MLQLLEPHDYAARYAKWRLENLPIVPDQAKFPDMTALWHAQQQAIQAGTQDKQPFLAELVQYISAEVAAVKAKSLNIKVDTQPCSLCGRPLRRIKGPKGFFWGCTGFSDGCPGRAADNHGKPVQISVPPPIIPVQYVVTLYSGGPASPHPTKPASKQRQTFGWGVSITQPINKRTPMSRVSLVIT